MQTTGQRDCQRKNAHRTEAKALRAAARLAGRARVRHLRVYRCPHCACWHLTKRRPSDG